MRDYEHVRRRDADRKEHVSILKMRHRKDLEKSPWQKGKSS